VTSHIHLSPVPSAAFADADRRLALVVELTDVGTWSVDLATGATTHDERMARILGVAHDDARAPVEIWRALLHPDDAARVRATFERAAATAGDGVRRYATTHRIVRADGEERFLATAADVIVDGAGVPVRLTGVARDITADREAQAARARTAADLADAMDRMSDAFFAYDPAWRFSHLNRAASERLTAAGIDAARVVGQVLWETIPGLCGTAFEAQMRRAMEERVSVRFEAPDPVTAGWIEVQAYPTAHGVAAYVRDVTAVRRMIETQRFLSQVGEVVAASLDYEATLAAVARLALPMLSDYCVVDLLEESGVVRRVATAHVDPACGALVERLRAAVPTLDSRSFVAEVLRTGEPRWGTATAPVVHSVSTAPDFLAAVTALAPESYCCVPMIARNRTIGSLLLVRTTPTRRPPFSPDDVQLAVEVAHRAAFAVDNARLFRAEHVARERVERLQRVTSALAGVATERDVAEILVSNLTEVLQPRVVAFFGVDAAEADAELRLKSVRGLTPAEERRFASFRLDGDAPIAEIVRTGDAVFLESHAAFQARYPFWSDQTRAGSGEAWAALGLRSSAGEPLGGVAFGFAARREFTHEERRYVEAIVFQAAQALERVALNQAERRARRVAEEANRAKMEFLAVMSHELRTPLNAIAGYAELIDLGIHGPVTDEMRVALSNIQRSQRHLLGLIDEVLTFARLDSGRSHLCLALVDVDEVVRGAEPLVRPQMVERTLEYAHHGASTPAVANVDRERVEQIVINLLSNAIKFTEPGGTITTQVEATGASVVVRVADTGIGIAPEKLMDIFEPFVQADSTLTRTRSGAGLGLAIARKLARAMDGDLTVESVVGVGTTFTLVLPRHGGAA
jgi:PAS domain S-box-containing protein